MASDPWAGVPYDPADPLASMPEAFRREAERTDALYAMVFSCPHRYDANDVTPGGCGCAWPFRCRGRGGATVYHGDCLACVREKTVDSAAASE